IAGVCEDCSDSISELSDFDSVDCSISEILRNRSIHAFTDSSHTLTPFDATFVKWRSPQIWAMNLRIFNLPSQTGHKMCTSTNRKVAPIAPAPRGSTHRRAMMGKWGGNRQRQLDASPPLSTSQCSLDGS
ncbi:hypothetical protein PFISCL1PPCAC_3928, partial [Pristionchus fissidentatus]